MLQEFARWPAKQRVPESSREGLRVLESEVINVVSGFLPVISRRLLYSLALAEVGLQHARLLGCTLTATNLKPYTLNFKLFGVKQGIAPR